MKKTFHVLCLVLLFLATIPTYVRASPGVHVNVPHSPLSVGESVYIEYYTDPGEDGTASVYIRSPSGGADRWSSGPVSITGGLLYDVTAPGLTTPGTYIAGATVWLGAIPGPTILAEFTFQVVGGAAFDFTISLSPPSLTVKQSETARYQILISYSDPSYSGTSITVQVMGLGPGMNYQLTPSPPSLSISTSQATPPSSYNIILRGSAMGVVHETSAVLIVEKPAPPFDFGLFISESTPRSQSVKAGQSATFTINVSLLSGTAQLVTLSLNGNPVDTTYSFSPNSGSPSFSSNLVISTGSSAPPGAYSLTITGQAGSVQHATIVQLTIGKAKSTSSMSISVNPTSVKMDEAVSVAGVLSPGTSTTIDIMYRRPDGFELTRHVATSATGSFSDSFTPDIEGPWSVFARWGGNDALDGSESTSANFNVEARPPPPPPSFWEQIPGGLATPLIAVIAVIAIVSVAASRRGHRSESISRQPAPTVTTRRCPKCGSEASAGSVYCASCGGKLP